MCCIQSVTGCKKKTIISLGVNSMVTAKKKGAAKKAVAKKKVVAKKAPAKKVVAQEKHLRRKSSC